MKIILTEQQTQSLIGNVTNADLFGGVDFEKDAPELMKALKGFRGISSNNLSDKVSSTKNVISKVVEKIKPNEMLHPLGRKVPISSEFGLRDVETGSKNHKGIDLSTPSGSSVYAPLDGKVISARDTTPNPCGGFIQLSHGEIKTKFCHLRKLVVKPGDEVKKGQIIGYTGGGKNDPMKGRSTGPHLHYEILGSNNIAMNPKEYQSNLAESWIF